MTDTILVIQTDRRELLVMTMIEGKYTYGESFSPWQLTFRQPLDKRVVGELNFYVQIAIGSCGVVPPDLFKGRFDLKIGDGTNWYVLHDCVVDPDTIAHRWHKFYGTYESSYTEIPLSEPKPQRKPDPSSYNSFLLGL